MRVLALAGPVIELCGAGVPISFVPRPPDDPTVRQPDIRLARESLSWEPKTDLRGGLTATIARFAVELGVTLGSHTTHSPLSAPAMRRAATLTRAR